MTVQTKHYTIAEYLAQEEHAEFRSEYRDGEIVPMTGGTPAHNRVTLNFASALNVAFKQRPFEVFINDLRLWIPDHRCFTYPDIMVVAGEPKLLAGRRDTVTNPILIAEILSDSTEQYDRGEKFKMYRSLPSLREVLLISQREMWVEQFIKDERGQWRLLDAKGEQAILELASVPFELPLADMYDKVALEGPADPPESERR